MKNFCLLLGLATSLLVSCSTDVVDEVVNGSNHSYVVNDEGHKITESEALDIANRFLKSTRSSSDFNVSYVLNNGKAATRAVGVSDTLAYILNRADDNGFIVIATDDRVNPVLAFSEEGKFEYEESYDDIVYANFVNKIDDYMATIDENDTAVDVREDFLVSCYAELPKIYSSWKQTYPYNKYVIKEHPSCPVGCGAVAAGQIMLYGKKYLTYHDSLYHMQALRRTFEENKKYWESYEGGIISNYSTRIIGGPDKTNYTYAQALDIVAQLLYWIGKDVDMQYTTLASTTTTEKVIELLRDLDYKFNSQLTTFVDTTVMRHLMNGSIIYADGVDLYSGQAHAWVIDGGRFCWKDGLAGEIMDSPYLHCDWGWGGYRNGYYLGKVFSIKEYGISIDDEYLWRDMYYFAIGHN